MSQEQLTIPTPGSRWKDSRGRLIKIIMATQYRVTFLREGEISTVMFMRRFVFVDSPPQPLSESMSPHP